MGKILDFFRYKKRPVNEWKIPAAVEPYRRLAWFPEVEEKVSARDASKFSGVPVLAKGEEWPACGHCNEPMQLFLQLNSAQLPNEAGSPFGDGFLQVFYCTNWEKECEVECEAFYPFAKSTQVRLLPPSTAVDTGSLISPVKDAFPEASISGWTSRADYPNWEEAASLGCTLSDEESDALGELGYPLPKDKLLGWPYWVQGVEYPNCNKCGAAMRLVFQIDSEDNLPYMFGDVGCAHVTQCHVHREVLAIAWACC